MYNNIIENELKESKANIKYDESVKTEMYKFSQVLDEKNPSGIGTTDHKIFVYSDDVAYEKRIGIVSEFSAFGDFKDQKDLSKKKRFVNKMMKENSGLRCTTDVHVKKNDQDVNVLFTICTKYDHSNIMKSDEDIIKDLVDNNLKISKKIGQYYMKNKAN